YSCQNRRRTAPDLAAGLCTPRRRGTFNRTDRTSAKPESAGGEGAAVASSATPSRTPSQTLRRADYLSARRARSNEQGDETDYRFFCRVPSWLHAFVIFTLRR